MEVGQYYHSNAKRLATLKDADWGIALAKCEEHIKLRLRQKTLYGVHSQSSLGADPVDHYLSLAYEKLISGDWEFQYDLTEQLIRIIDSYISKAIEHADTAKSQALKIKYTEKDIEFYEALPPSAFNSEGDEADDKKYLARVISVDEAVQGDIELELLWDGVKEGKKRADIAALLEKTPRQFDKLREKLIKKVKSQQSIK